MIFKQEFLPLKDRYTPLLGFHLDLNNLFCLHSIWDPLNPTLFTSHLQEIRSRQREATTRKINSAPFSTNWLWHTISFFRLQSCFAQKQLEGTMILISRLQSVEECTKNYLHQGSRNVKKYGGDKTIPYPDKNRINLSAKLLWTKTFRRPCIYTNV